MRCPHCQSETVVKNGTRRLQGNRIVQYYRCRGCTQTFNARTGTPVARLRTPPSCRVGSAHHLGNYFPEIALALSQLL